MPAVDVDELASELVLVNHKRNRSLEILEAVREPPVLTRTIDGATTLEVTVSDPHRRIVRNPDARIRSWAVVDDLHFELVAISKTGDRFTLTFEDAVVAQLRRQRGKLSVPAGSTTRREFTLRLAREARVKAIVDPTHEGRVHSVLARRDGANSWDVLGTDVAEPIQWRRFSDGRRLVVGGDPWLLDRDPNPSRFREFAGPCQSIDFDLDVGRRASEATIIVDSKLWALPPGSAVILEDLGPADGKWLVSEFERTLTRTRATVTLTRKRHVLDEPPPERSGGDRGEPHFLPDQDGVAGAPTTGARERMVSWALAQRGKPYVWGGSGPNGFDCSGLVQEATRAAGKVLPKPSASQWAACVRAGRTCSVETAIATRGGLLFRIGVGEYNHVAISLGNGSTMEALGSAYGCGVFSAANRGWTGGALWL